MLVKIEAQVLVFSGTDFHFPSTSVPPGTFLGSAMVAGACRLRPDTSCLVTTMSCARTAEAIEVLFRMRTRASSARKEPCTVGVRISQGKGHF